VDFRIENDEVLVAMEPLVHLSAADLDDLKARAGRNPRARVRICAHSDVEDALHEMVIVHTRGAYVPPHKHLGKAESTHVIEGRADAVMFEDNGAVRDVIRLGEPGSGRSFYVRLDEAVYHTLLIESDFFVFHEVTSGPFVRDNTVLAPWAPDETDPDACAAWQKRIAAGIGAS
jgi:cupin fold WbuC family metalloprotein